MYGASGASSGSPLPPPAWTRRTPSTHTRTLDRAAAVIASTTRADRFLVFRVWSFSVGCEDDRGECERPGLLDARPRMGGIAAAPARVVVGHPAIGDPFPGDEVARLPQVLHRELHALDAGQMPGSPAEERAERLGLGLARQLEAHHHGPGVVPVLGADLLRPLPPALGLLGALPVAAEHRVVAPPRREEVERLGHAGGKRGHRGLGLCEERRGRVAAARLAADLGLLVALARPVAGLLGVGVEPVADAALQRPGRI